jgi:hypothetical protein
VLEIRPTDGENKIESGKQYFSSFRFHIFFRIFNFFDLSFTEETWVVEMRIWCIKIGNVLVLHFNPWVQVSAGALLGSEGFYSPVARYVGTCFKIRIWFELSRKK